MLIFFFNFVINILKILIKKKRILKTVFIWCVQERECVGKETVKLSGEFGFLIRV